MLPLRTTATPERAVHECVVTMMPSGSRVVRLPVAVVGEPGPTGLLARARVYHSTWPLTGRHEVRPRCCPRIAAVELRGAVAAYMEALAAGDLAGILASFDEAGCAREPSGGDYTYCGRDELAKFYAALFSNGGGIQLEHSRPPTTASPPPSSTTPCAGAPRRCRSRPAWRSTSAAATVCSSPRAIYDDVDPPLDR